MPREITTSRGSEPNLLLEDIFSELFSKMNLSFPGLIESSTEEAGGGQRLLKEALDVLPTLPNEVNLKRDILQLSILNQLAIIDSTR